MMDVSRCFCAPHSILAALALFLFAVSSPAFAQQVDAGSPLTREQGTVEPVSPKSIPKPYAIEFRARNAHNYGHTFSIYGRLSPQGKFISPRVSGLHPATESPVPWMVGHLVAVPSETGASDGDTEDQYVLARFRVALTEGEYRKVTAYIKQLSGKSPLWHAVVYNCNAFIGDIAGFMGLLTPKSTMLLPQEYIETLRDLNIGRSNATGVIGTPVKVQDAAALRAATLKTLEQRGRQAAPSKPGATAVLSSREAPAPATPRSP
jgi:hypothetical protein